MTPGGGSDLQQPDVRWNLGRWHTLYATKGGEGTVLVGKCMLNYERSDMASCFSGRSFEIWGLKQPTLLAVAGDRG